MNENIDLSKILEGCPVGTEFYHVVYGKVWFDDILNGDSDEYCFITFSLCDESHTVISVTKKGTFSMRYDGECLIFPSKDQRDWSKFERFWDKPDKVDRFDPNTLKPFDKILVRKVHSKYNIEPWSCEHFSYINPNTKELVNGISSRYEICIPYNDETEHLLGTTDDCPEYYKWWGELF